MNVVARLARVAESAPDRPALIDADTDSVLSFADLVTRVRLAGASLTRHLPGEAGARVAILDDATTDYLCAEYGVMGAGFVRVPLDGALNADELAQQVRDADARLVLYSDRFADLAGTLAAAVPGCRAVALTAVLEERDSSPLASCDAGTLDADACDAHACDADTLASLNYTGGSTGRPKAVMHSHGTLGACLDNIVAVREIAPGDVFLNMRPVWPIAAIIVLAHLVAGGAVVLGGRFTPKRFAALMARYRVAQTSLVPTQIVRLLEDSDVAHLETAHLKRVDIGAAALPADVLARARVFFGDTIAMLYGLTEAPWSCYRPPRDVDIIETADAATHGYVGRPAGAASLRIADSTGPGDVGEVWISGPHVMRGYWKQPELTAEAMVDGWFRTGDLGRLDARGLFLVGRAKDVIRSGGKSVQPNEVEEALARHPAIAEAGVAALPDPEWGEVVAAGIVLRPAAALNAAELDAHCRATLSAHKRPKVVRVFTSLPRSHYGKIQRAVLRDMMLAGEREGSILT